MFKTNEEIIIIQAKATTPIPTGVVFWSHDKGTAKMLFQLQKDYVNQTLSEGTIVPICLDFVGGRHIYHAVIEDAVNGIVSIVLEDNILGYVGRVTGSIYIELPDSRSLDTAGRFTFDIKRSPIDENVPELEDYYWQGFNEIMAQYRQTIATIKLEAKELLDSLTADVTTAQSKVAKLEQSITTANTNLNARIDEISKKIDDNDVFTKAESSANVIDQVIGNETSTRNITTDMKNKVATSVIENPNLAFTS
ncbi:BppU family phage baseplate upper protein, partial [Enterococcus devriesei]